MIINNVIGEVLQQLPQPLWENWYIKEMIGSGSFSAVFRVEATRTKRVDSAALKIEPILPDERFASNEERRISLLQQKKADIEEESTIMYKLKGCQNVVSYEDEDIKEFYRDGKIAGYVFLIRMELLQNVYDLMNSRKLNTEEANIIRLGKEIGNGLKAAHDIGVIHRDVKPSNFFISETGIYKLGDFNIAKQTSYTRSFAGTEGYIAPEVYRAKTGDSESYTAQADIYSLGICLYQFMNDGMFPFEETELTETAIDKRMSGEQIPPPKNASEAFGKIILKACAYSPEDRYANMSEMLADLDKLESGRVSAYSEGASFTVPTARATVYADSESVHANSETVYADASVYKPASAKKSSKKFIIPIAIAAFLLLSVAAIFAIIKMQDNNTDNDTTVTESSEISTEATSSSASVAQTTMAETTTEATTTTTNDPHEFVGIINTKSDDLSVRAAPSYDAEILGTIPKDTEVKAYTLDDNKDWCRIEYAEKGLSGYSCSHYIMNKDKHDEVVPHDWLDATMTKPRTCSVCGATEGEPLYGTGWCDNLDCDVDNDGENEHIEVYLKDDYYMEKVYYYRVYDNDDYVDYDCYTSSFSSWDAIVYDSNFDKRYICKYYSHVTYGGGKMILEGLNDTTNLKIHIGAVDWDHPENGQSKNYFINDKEVSKEEFDNYMRNVIVIYSYSDSTGSFLNALKSN